MNRKISLAGAACALLLIGVSAAEAQGFYPREWGWGRSGLFSPDYITPYADEPGYLTGGEAGDRSARAGRLVFAAAKVDQLCQQDGSPTITVLDAPRGGRISSDIGRFVASRNDAGSKYCIGRMVRGTRLFYRGRANGGERIVVRVAYPNQGLAYDHVVALR